MNSFAENDFARGLVNNRVTKEGMSHSGVIHTTNHLVII